MLAYTSLEYIDSVLNDSNGKAKATMKAQLLYIRIIIKHLKSIEATIENIKDFVIDGTIIKFEQFAPELEELARMQLLQIKKLENKYSYVFYPVWGKFVDKVRLKPDPSNPNIKTIHKYEKDFLMSDEIIELVGMKEKINYKNATELRLVFIMEQKATDKIYQSLSDVKIHFINWVKTNTHLVTEQTLKTAKGNRYNG